MKNKLLTEAKFDAGCLMLDLNKSINNWGDVIGMIDKNDVYDTEDGSYGLERDPHCTILFGFEDSVTPDSVKQVTNDLNQPYISIELTGVSIFEASGDKEYDVVKFTVNSELMHELNKECKKMPHKSSFPNYVPHVTIGYVKKGAGKKYVKTLTPVLLQSKTFTYSDKTKNKTRWEIGK